MYTAELFQELRLFVREKNYSVNFSPHLREKRLKPIIAHFLQDFLVVGCVSKLRLGSGLHQEKGGNISSPSADSFFAHPVDGKIVMWWVLLGFKKDVEHLPTQSGAMPNLSGRS